MQITERIPVVEIRPPWIPPEIDMATIVQAVREHLLGADIQRVTLMLNVSVQQFHQIVKTRAWQTLQFQFRDEFLATTGSRMTRLESMIIDKLESMIDTGITCWGTNKQGETFEYHREMSPKELVSIGLMLSDTNKRLDRLREGDLTRKTFDAKNWMAKLEAKVIDVSTEKAA